MGERLADAVRVQQTGYGDLSVVHLPPLGPPGHVAEHRREDLVGLGQPGRAHVDPGAPGQLPALEPVEGRRLDRRRPEE